MQGRERRERRTAMMFRVTVGGGKSKYECSKNESATQTRHISNSSSRVAGRLSVFTTSVNINKQRNLRRQSRAKSRDGVLTRFLFLHTVRLCDLETIT